MRLAAAILAGISINLLLIGPVAIRSAFDGRGDFSAFYIGAQLGKARYDANAVENAQQHVMGEVHPVLMPIRLPFYYLLLEPLTKLPYRQAVIVWDLIMLASGIGAVLIYPFQKRAALATAWAFSSMAVSILAGQDVALICLILALGLKLRSQKRLFLSGLVLSLLAIKFHLFLLLPAVSFMKREFSLLRGLVAGSVLLLALSFAAGGITWPAQYFALIRNPVVGPQSSSMPNLHGLASFFPHSGWIELSLSILVISVMFASKQNLIEVGLLGSFLISMHAYNADTAILVPTVLGSFISRRSIFALLLLTPLMGVFAEFGLGFVPAALITIVFSQELRPLHPDRTERQEGK